LDLDFCVLFSSIAAILGGLGYAAYAAANLYMDAYAARRNRGSRVPWLSVNWDGLQQAPGERQDVLLGVDLSALAMTPEETGEAFRRVLSLSGAPQVVVSTGDLRARLDRWVRFGVPGEAEAAPAAGSSLHFRPSLQTIYVAPTDETERAITRMWQELLGVAQVGIHDDFFELGGDSLLATRLLSALRRHFRVEVSFRSLFEATTPAAQADLVRARVAGQVDPRAVEVPGLGHRSRSIAEQLAELTALSDEVLEGGAAPETDAAPRSGRSSP
jgi:aryl carrier-like protein